MRGYQSHVLIITLSEFNPQPSLYVKPESAVTIRTPSTAQPHNAPLTPPGECTPTHLLRQLEVRPTPHVLLLLHLLLLLLLLPRHHSRQCTPQAGCQCARAPHHPPTPQPLTGQSADLDRLLLLQELHLRYKKRG